MTHIEAYVAPVWVNRGMVQDPRQIRDNGTITFVDLGWRRVGVTAHHVIAKYRQEVARSASSGLAINLGSRVTPFITDVHVIDEDKDRDIAVIALPDELKRPGHNKRFFLHRYPAVSPRLGDAMTVVGYPGELRKTTATWGSFSPHGIGMTVSNAPGNNVMLVDSSRTLRTVDERTGKRVPHINPGGMSGSAGFFFYENQLRLGGFVYEGHPGVLFLVPATLLEPDGRLAR